MRALSRYKTQLALCLRVTMAALLAFGLGRALSLPLVLWAVLTAVILTQASVGKSVKATIDYLLGTLGGAVYAGAIMAFAPHATDAETAAVLAIAIAPLALLAAFSPRYATSPSTGAIVVLAPGLVHAASLAPALERVEEVALGGAVALLVSFVVFPGRARASAKLAAATMLDGMAQALPELFKGFTQARDAERVLGLQRDVAATFAEFEAAIAEARHERMSLVAEDAEFESLRTVLLRLRHDLVMLGRTAASPLPHMLRDGLEPKLSRVEETVADFLRGCAAAMRSDGRSPASQAAETALDSFGAQVERLRSDGVLRPMSFDTLEGVFALTFALEQWRRDLEDLGRRVSEHARRSAPEQCDEASQRRSQSDR
ncbi:MAG TPA: FUSC family protein [Methylocystis sp.]|nr:FUSC family protein [Methylocystis sp.]